MGGAIVLMLTGTSLLEWYWIALLAVASLGRRPTVDGTDMLLEVHVFDFAADLYGREIEVECVAKLRDEVKFDSLDALIVQMKIDAAVARELLTKVSCD